ncbi:hypothetical protein PHSY_002952 [Pseudozyma hubeiensis SY62]|uniref:Uncharacterized protein n=1 Tax=Pseudozyma hubeiensis (strain SY62) TaxID=1305764 RepID=R9P2F8_PSEHS|nr:hypothetical protein PHSY_002952 [Pseudozyma hubeiensis SY62]GAC95377.1 hypothetical protein PHSY_002952 [Pseudozyma hubeiensis SY62]
MQRRWDDVDFADTGELLQRCESFGYAVSRNHQHQTQGRVDSGCFSLVLLCTRNEFPRQWDAARRVSRIQTHRRGKIE